MNMEAETICGYPVTAEDKKRNKMFLDMLTEFENICKKNGIGYLMFYGGLIGTVRHKGFIPWDDDIDIVMLRKDFDKLYYSTNEQLGVNYPYMIQNPVTDPECIQAVMRFRRSDTSSIKPNEYKVLKSGNQKEINRLNYNMGMEICIFPLDLADESSFRYKLKSKISWRLLSMIVHYQEYESKSFYRKFAIGFINLLGKRRFMNLVQKSFKTSKKSKGNKYRALTYRSTFERELIENTVRLPFEDITVPAPAGYDKILTTIYGSYMEFPKVEEIVGHDRFVSPEIPYKEAVLKIKNGEL